MLATNPAPQSFYIGDEENAGDDSTRCSIQGKEITQELHETANTFVPEGREKTRGRERGKEATRARAFRIPKRTPRRRTFAAAAARSSTGASPVPAAYARDRDARQTDARASHARAERTKDPTEGTRTSSSAPAARSAFTRSSSSASSSFSSTIEFRRAHGDVGGSGATSPPRAFVAPASVIESPIRSQGTRIQPRTSTESRNRSRTPTSKTQPEQECQAVDGASEMEQVLNNLRQDLLTNARRRSWIMIRSFPNGRNIQGLLVK